MSGPRTDDDVDVRGVLTGAAGIVAAVVVAAAAAWLGWSHWLAGTEPGPDAKFDFKVEPPRLESAPVAERDAYFAEKQHLLHTWQWIDRERGIARIPIEEAMHILGQRQAPGRPPGVRQ